MAITMQVTYENIPGGTMTQQAAFASHRCHRRRCCRRRCHCQRPLLSVVVDRHRRTSVIPHPVIVFVFVILITPDIVNVIVVFTSATKTGTHVIAPVARTRIQELRRPRLRPQRRQRTTITIAPDANDDEDKRCDAMPTTHDDQQPAT